MDLDELSHSPDGERRITVTARALMLTRDVAVQDSDEEIYDPEHGHVLPPWDHDTIVGGLGLTAACIDAWRGKRVLDVASGLGLMGTELSALDVQVDCVDLEMGDGHPSFAKAAEHVRAHYANQLRRLRELADTGDPRYAIGDDLRRLLDRLIDRADEIAKTYPAVSGNRRVGDATTLAGFELASYDATTSGWLMVHLEPDDERRVIESMLRVTKPGGYVHVRAGYGGDAGDRARRWFGDAVSIDKALGDLVVLRRRL